MCFGDSLFMSLHATRYRRQLNRLEIVSIPERASQPCLGGTGQSLHGELAKRFEGIASETLVLDPTINWLAHRSE